MTHTLEGFGKKVFAPGEKMLTQDAIGVEAYLIEKGTVRVYLERGGRVVELAELGPGEIVGEMSLLTRDKNAASVSAIDEAHVSVITPDILDQKIEDSDPLIRSLISMLVERVRSTDAALLESETREYIEIAFI